MACEPYGNQRRVAQQAEATDLKSVQCGFESHLADQIAHVVYVVFTPCESRENNGSSPSWAILIGDYANLVDGCAWKSRFLFSK